uniref:Uncharacterized protein n=1 Tax=Oryza meridionalis TaxID=40149 RepID=A0A0E0E3Y6_9ORYZ
MEPHHLLLPTSNSFCITGTSFKRRSCLNLNKTQPQQQDEAIILPKTWLKNLSMLAYVSAVGLVSSVALTMSLVWAGMADKSFHMAGSSLLNITLNLYSICFAGHGLFSTVYSSMKSNKRCV